MTGIYCLTVPEARRLRSRFQLVCFLLRPLSFVFRWPPSPSLLTWPFFCVCEPLVSLYMSTIPLQINTSVRLHLDPTLVILILSYSPL